MPGPGKCSPELLFLLGHPPRARPFCLSPLDLFFSPQDLRESTGSSDLLLLLLATTELVTSPPPSRLPEGAPFLCLWDPGGGSPVYSLPFVTCSLPVSCLAAPPCSLVMLSHSPSPLCLAMVSEMAMGENGAAGRVLLSLHAGEQRLKQPCESC